MKTPHVFHLLTSNEVFQEELAEVARSSFAGKFIVNLGFSAVGPLSAANIGDSLAQALRDKSASELRRMNFDLLTKRMGVAEGIGNAFLNNPAISPTVQTLIVSSLGQLGNIPGQAAFIREAASSQDERDAFSYQQCVALMAKWNQDPVARITFLRGLPVCQTKSGGVMVPIQWDYAAWTPLADRFINALKAEAFTPAPTGYALVMTGDMSPLGIKAFAAHGVTVSVLSLPGPLK